VSKRFEERRKQQLEQERLERGGKVQPAKSGRVKTTAKAAAADRFNTLNQFVDLVSRHLALPARCVWLDLFRNARQGKVFATTRQLAERAGLDPKTVTTSLATLKRVGLVWQIAQGVRKQPSVYGLHPNPGRCLQRVIDAQQRSGRRRDITPARAARNRGKRSND